MLHLLPFVINLYIQPTDKGVHIGFFYTGSDPIQHSNYPTLSLLRPHPDFWRPLIITDKTWTFWQKLFPLCMLDWTDIYFLYFLNKNGLTNQNFCSIKNVQWCTYNIFQNSSSLLIDSKKKRYRNFNIYHVALNQAFQNAHIYIYIYSDRIIIDKMLIFL